MAIGGNALTAEDQTGTWQQITANADTIVAPLAQLVHDGWQVVVVHGNGPQVGNLAMQQEAGQAQVPAQPLHQLCAMTQGQLGGVLVRAIDRRCGEGVAVAIVTHVRIDPNDAAFASPSKPIGPFFDAQQAQALAAEGGWTVAEDSGRGYRRVVASPRPGEVVEMRAIRALLESGHVVLAAGGGGVAVDADLVGIDAIIDKDHTAAALATAVGASELYLVTGVDCVLLDFGTARQRPAHTLTPGQAEQHLADGQFSPGSMGPKMRAALRFLSDGGHRAIITSARLLAAAVAGEPGVGTIIAPAPPVTAEAS